MAWIKRNYGLVAGLAIGLILLGVAGFFLKTKMDAAAEVTAKLEETTQRLTGLYNRNPRPNPDNITAGKEDEKKLQSFITEVRRFFVPPTPPPGITSRSFGLLLDKKFKELNQLAKYYSVKLPPDYKYSFASQATNVSIPPDALDPLIGHSMDVGAICRLLFESKITSLQLIKRPSVTGENTYGATDFLLEKSITNALTITTPYEISFKGFSADLDAVLEAFQKSEGFICVTNLSVGPAVPDAVVPPVGLPVTPAFGNPFPPSDSPVVRGPDRSRYGGGGRYAPPPPPVMVAPPTRPSTGIMLEEQLLQFTLSLVTVRSKPPEKEVAAPPPASPGGTEPAVP